MPWITLNESNWEQYLVRAQDVEGGDNSLPDRTTWSGDTVSGTSVPADNNNSIMNYYIFNGYSAKPSQVTNCSAVRVINVAFIQDPIPDGYHGQIQYATGVKQVIDANDTLVAQDAPYNLTGGKQLVAVSEDPVTIVQQLENYNLTPNAATEVNVPFPGLGLVQGGSAIITENDSTAEIMLAIASWQIEVFVEDDPEPPAAATPKNYVYEMEKGWSFDGNYIPNYLELNWFWGDNPVDMTGVQKIRIHGLTKGFAKLTVAVNGMETDMLDYLPYYSEPQIVDLPRQPYFVSDEYYPVTNYTDTAARGLSVQMKFEGSNLNRLLPEPSHVIQVLVIQATPQGTGARAN